MSDCTDNQDVGLEAATIQRVRNSSLVEWFCADNVAGLKPVTEAMGCAARRIGRGALPAQRRWVVRPAGGLARENVGMSSVRRVRNTSTVNLRFPTEG